MKAVQAPKSLSPLRSANKAEVAEFFDVSVGSVEAWIRRGCPVFQRGRRGYPWIIDLLAVAQWRYGVTDEPERTDPDDMTPKDRKDWYDGEKKRREMMVEDRELIPVSEFDAEYSRVIKIVAAGLETLPDKLELDAGLTGLQLQPVIRTVDTMRETLYQLLTDRQAHGA